MMEKEAVETFVKTERSAVPHKHGGDIYSYQNVRDFSANINFRGMPESVRIAAQESVLQSVHYPDPAYRALREALAYRENRIVSRQHVSPGKPAVCPQQIICGNGAAELMFALAAACRPQKALVAAPSFFEYEQALAAFGCEITRFYLKKENNFRLEKDFLQAITDRTELIILGNPNNPTGQVLQSDFLEELLEICRRRRILLVLDESFFDFLDMDSGECRETFSGVNRFGDYPNLFVMKSFTKMYAMPGLRFGYGICSDTELLTRMRLVLQPWNVSVPAQNAAQAAAAELEFAGISAMETAKNREAMKKALEQAGYRVYPSGANFLLFEGPENLQELCLEKGFLIRDCSNFPGLAKGFFRVCVRSEEENNALLEALQERTQKNGKSDHGPGDDVKCRQERGGGRAVPDFQTGRLSGGAV